MRLHGLQLLEALYNAHPAFLHVLGPPPLVRVLPTLSYLLASMCQLVVLSQLLGLDCFPAPLVGSTGLLQIIVSLGGSPSSLSMFPLSPQPRLGP
uniref:Uncharacterized protein n=1 Tax=Beet black scorch virus TaxID=196375 RepID=D1GV38_9TOMB|nr:10K hypothetical protein, p10 [Beet black scorch virus]